MLSCLALPKKEFLQILEASELLDSGIGYLGAVEIEIFQVLQSLEMLQSGVGHLGILEMEPSQRFHPFELLQALVRNLGATEIHPFDFGGDRLERGQAVVLKFLGDVQCTESQFGSVLGDAHERCS